MTNQQAVLILESFVSTATTGPKLRDAIRLAIGTLRAAPDRLDKKIDRESLKLLLQEWERREAQRQRRARKRRPKLQTSCEQCGIALLPERTTNRFCSSGCRVKAWRESRKKK